MCRYTHHRDQGQKQQIGQESTEFDQKSKWCFPTDFLRIFVTEATPTKSTEWKRNKPRVTVAMVTRKSNNGEIVLYFWFFLRLKFEKATLSRGAKVKGTFHALKTVHSNWLDTQSVYSLPELQEDSLSITFGETIAAVFTGSQHVRFKLSTTTRIPSVLAPNRTHIPTKPWCSSGNGRCSWVERLWAGTVVLLRLDNGSRALYDRIKCGSCRSTVVDVGKQGRRPERALSLGLGFCSSGGDLVCSAPLLSSRIGLPTLGRACLRTSSAE